MTDRTYQVLARKWRPQQFDDVVGQRAVVRTLKNALDQGRVAHAYCFSGIRGVGKTTLARLLAMGLNCQASDSPTSAPCGACESCHEIESSRSLDVVELDAASRTGVDDIRELNEVARYAPSRDRHRVFIIDEAHMLSTAANNALLKTLEEPPPRVVFILATTEPSKILPTVLSRCQHYQFGRISHGEIGAHLGKIAAAESVEISADALALVATAADGSLRDAQSLLDKLVAFGGDTIDERIVIDLLGLVDRVLLFRATDLIAGEDLPGTLGFVNEMVDSGVDLHRFAVDLMGHFRDLLVVRSVPDPGAILHLPEDDLTRLRGQAEAFRIDDLDRAFSLLAASEYRIKMAEQPRYHLEIVLSRLARLPRLEPIEDLLAALREGGDTKPGPPSVGSGGGGGARRRPAPAKNPARTASPPAAKTPRSTAGKVAPPSPKAAARPTPRPAPEPTIRPTPRPAPVRASGERPGRAPEPSPRSADPELPPWITEPPPLGVDHSAASSVSEPSSADAKPSAAPERTAAPAPTTPPAPAPAAPAPTPAVAVVAVATATPAAAPTTPVAVIAPADTSADTSAGAPSDAFAATGADPADEDPGESPVHRPASDLPAPALLRRIQEQLDQGNPLIAQVLGRSCGLSMAGETVAFQFPESAGIFAERVRDPEVLRLLAAAGERVLGRRVIARVEMVANAVRPAEPEVPADAEADTVAAAAETPEPAVAPRAKGPPAEGLTVAAPPDTVSPADMTLRDRAEQNPLVQEMLHALKGQLVSVEEL